MCKCQNLFFIICIICSLIDGIVAPKSYINNLLSKEKTKQKLETQVAEQKRIIDGFKNERAIEIIKADHCRYERDISQRENADLKRIYEQLKQEHDGLQQLKEALERKSEKDENTIAAILSENEARIHDEVQRAIKENELSNLEKIESKDKLTEDLITAKESLSEQITMLTENQQKHQSTIEEQKVEIDNLRYRLGIDEELYELRNVTFDVPCADGEIVKVPATLLESSEIETLQLKSKIRDSHDNSKQLYGISSQQLKLILKYTNDKSLSISPGDSEIMYPSVRLYSLDKLLARMKHTFYCHDDKRSTIPYTFLYEHINNENSDLHRISSDILDNSLVISGDVMNQLTELMVGVTIDQKMWQKVYFYAIKYNIKRLLDLAESEYGNILGVISNDNYIASIRGRPDGTLFAKVTIFKLEDFKAGSIDLKTHKIGLDKLEIAHGIFFYKSDGYKNFPLQMKGAAGRQWVKQPYPADNLGYHLFNCKNITDMQSDKTKSLFEERKSDSGYEFRVFAKLMI